MATNTEEYIRDTQADIGACIDDKGCQPILFIGSGLSKRYFRGPNWIELLDTLANACPNIDKEIAFYRQTHGDPIDIGEVFAEKFMDWAWDKGRKSFPKKLFESPDSQVFIKHFVCEHFKKLTPNAITGVKPKALQKEIKLLQDIRPHAVITTNYDTFLETVFPDHEPVVGQQILRTSFSSVGEIYKIHGCVSDPSSIVLTRRDYDEFLRKKKYLSAKLLTYFAEHPLLFIGYSAEDPNIKAILADIDEILAANEQLVPNIFILLWNDQFDKLESFQREKVISVGEGKSIRIRSIIANSFDWVFESFSSKGELEQVSPKVLRAILSRTYEMVRHDIPKKTIEVDYSMLAKIVDDKGALPKLYGIATLDNPATTNAYYPYTLTAVGKKLGFKQWHGAKKLLDEIMTDTGVNLKESDNRYHVALKTGESAGSLVHKYSESMVELLKLVKAGKDYELEL